VPALAALDPSREVLVCIRCGRCGRRLLEVSNDLRAGSVTLEIKCWHRDCKRLTRIKIEPILIP
jgi:phage FluMu protein Com